MRHAAGVELICLTCILVYACANSQWTCVCELRVDNANATRQPIRQLLETTLILRQSRDKAKEDWPVEALHLVLFAHTGCYGHDVLMRQIGAEFGGGKEDSDGSGDSGDKEAVRSRWHVTWTQILMHDFGFAPSTRPSHWNEIVLDRSREPDAQLLDEGHALMWELLLPFDVNKPWDLRGALFFLKLIMRSNALCADFHRMVRFKDFLRAAAIRPPQLIVVDHLIQECFTMAASLFNTTTIQFSNWPISDRYVSLLNVPTNPSYVPVTTTPFEGRHAMTLQARLYNTLFYVSLHIGRLLQSAVVEQFYASLNHVKIQGNMADVEASHLFYAARSEFLFDVIRPMSNRIKHFGCTYCRPPNEYYIRVPASNRSFGDVDTAANYTVMEMRYKQIKRDFPALDLALLDERRFILVSFGSVAKVEFMPDVLLEHFLRAFGAASNFNVIWQTNSETQDVLRERRLRVPFPVNLHVCRWLPVRVLLAHRNIHYAIFHGGINTINELLMFGVPVLGVPLQGDQPSNLKRLTELGVGELALLRDVWAGELRTKMCRIENNYERYALRARLVASMANMYRDMLRPSGDNSLQTFWLRWAARHGKRLRASPAIFRSRYRSYVDYFGLTECGMLLAVLVGCVFSLTQ